MNLSRTQLTGIATASLVLAVGLGYGIGVSTSKSVSPSTQPANPEVEEPKSDKPAPFFSKISIKTDPLNDSKKYTLLVFADNEGSDAIGINKRATLIVRCQPSEKALFINTPEYLASHENHRIVLRWDGGSTTNQWWTPASGGGAAFSQAPMTMLATMAKHDKLVLGYTPWNKTQTSAIFDLKKVRKDLGTMQSYCN